VSFRIPFSKASFVGPELDYVAEAVAGGWISGNGPFAARCERLLEQALGAPRVILTTSCTDALEMSGLLLDLEPGDEVVMPTYTFVSCATAFALRRARPVFVDVLPGTLNLDPQAVLRAIGPRTRAILAVHYAGVGCEMDRLGEIAGGHGIPLLEDNAHGLFGRWRERPLGTFGRIATLSFHETKNFTCGEGGALVLNDVRDVERAEILRDKGTNRARFARGLVDKYTWVDLGSSFLPSDLLAAFLLAQLEARESILAARRRIWERYATGLASWARRSGVVLPHVPADAEPPWHMFQILLPDAMTRARLADALAQRGMLAVFHYVPLHLSEMGRKLGGAPGDCPVAEDAHARLLRLPFYNSLAESDQAEVIGAIEEFSV
jgi:dTDP-4-amino-4,6-dideoxygalactose transaminase